MLQFETFAFLGWVVVFFFGCLISVLTQ